jgi:hypothetical protein
MADQAARNTPRQTLRKAFKAAQRKKDRADFMCALSAVQISELSAAQVFKLMRFLDDATDSPQTGDVGTALLEQNLLQGILYNADLREWYDQKLSRLIETAQADVPYIWSMCAKGEEGFSQRLNDARDNACHELGMEAEFQDFFRVLGTLQLAADMAYARNGLMPFRDWRRMRFVQGLFPRHPELRQFIKMYGDFEDEAAHKSLVSFSRLINGAMNTLPQYLHRFLFDAGYMVRAASRLGHIDPDYAQQRPAYAREGTYEHAAMGVHVENDLAIDVPEYSIRQKDFEVEIVKAHDSFEDLVCTLAHESGHGICLVLGMFLQSPQVVAAYNDDLRSIRAIGLNGESASELAYYLPERDGGRHSDIGLAREEALVEIMAEIMLEEQGIYGQRSLNMFMPNMTVHARAIVQMLKRDYEIFPTGLEFPWGPRIHPAPWVRLTVPKATL